MPPSFSTLSQVSGISDLRLDDEHIAAGDTLYARQRVILSKGGRTGTLYQTLWSEDGRLVAHAKVGVLCLEVATHRVLPFPPRTRVLLKAD